MIQFHVNPWICHCHTKLPAYMPTKELLEQLCAQCPLVTDQPQSRFFFFVQGKEEEKKKSVRHVMRQINQSGLLFVCVAAVLQDR